MDEFGPLNLQPRPGRQWAAVSGKNAEPGRAPRRRMRATYTRTAGVRHLFAAYELGEDKLFGHIKPRKIRVRFLDFCRYLRTLYPPQTRIAIICDNFSPHLTTAKDARVAAWATTNNAEIAYTPTNSSRLNRVEAQFTALRYFTLDRKGRHACIGEPQPSAMRLVSETLARDQAELGRLYQRLLSATAHSAIHGLARMLAPVGPNEGRPGEVLAAVNRDPHSLAVELVAGPLAARALARSVEWFAGCDMASLHGPANRMLQVWARVGEMNAIPGAG